MPLNGGAAIETTILCTGSGAYEKAPVFLNKENPTGYAVHIMHRCKELCGNDTKDFRPERWDPNVDNEVNLKGIGLGYPPFNGGPRGCVGRTTPFSSSSFCGACVCLSICI